VSEQTSPDHRAAPDPGAAGGQLPAPGGPEVPHPLCAPSGITGPGASRPLIDERKYRGRPAGPGTWETGGYVLAGVLAVLGLAMLALFVVIIVQVNPQGNNK
jgi:hypothetical protein